MNIHTDSNLITAGSKTSRYDPNLQTSHQPHLSASLDKNTKD